MNEWFAVKQPSPVSQRFLPRVHEECYYYQRGIEVCRDRIANSIQETGRAPPDGFLSCKPVIDSFYRCTTRDYYGQAIEEMDGRAKGYFKNYAQCMFDRLGELGHCRAFYDDILRYYVDKPDSPLRKHY